MRIRVKIEHKYDIKNGVSRVGNPWRSQDIKCRILKEDGSESSETLVCSCSNDLLLDAPAIHVGAEGWVGCFMQADEFNGRCYQRVSMNGFTPQDFKAQMAAPVAEPAQEANATQQVAANTGDVTLPY